MADLIGLTCILIISFITFLVAIRYPKVSKIIYIALAVRVFVLLIGHYLITLPDSTKDALSFESYAFSLSKDGFFSVMEKYPGPSPRFISWLIAIPYSLIGRSMLMAKSMTLFFGVGSVFLSWKVTQKLWGNKIANNVGWIMALFPSLILYSALTLREVYVSFFLIVAFYGIVDWSKTKDLKSIALTLFGFTGATFFHGATFLGAMIFVGVITLITLNDFIKSIKYFRISVVNVFLLLILCYVLLLYFTNQISVPYLGNLEYLIDIEVITNKSVVNVAGVAAYPEWTKAKNISELIYKIPIRGVYFVFAPFPWNVTQTRHIIGMLDGLLYMSLAFIILMNIKKIWSNFTLRIIFIILISYIAIFSIGVGNFGTGIRHRSKFAFIFIFLAAPFVRNFTLLKKNKLKV